MTSPKKKGKKRKCRGDASTDGMGQNTIAGVLEHSTEVESPPERSRYPPNKEKRRRQFSCVLHLVEKG